MFAALCAGMAFADNAQAQVVYSDEAVSVTEFTCDPSTKYFSNWRDNWFIQLGAGVNQPFVERGQGLGTPAHNVWGKKMTAVYNVGVGRWFSPYMAFRINALGGALHWNNPTKAQPNNGWTYGKHANLNVDLMWDMFNSLGGVNPNRVFSMIPYVGLGGDAMWDIRDAQGNPAVATNIERTRSNEPRKMSWTLPVSAGMQFRLRLAKAVDFFGEMRANFYGDNWNLDAKGAPIEANVTAYGGLSFNINGRDWDTFNECDYMSQLANLNNEVNNLRAEVLTGAQTIAALQSQLPCPEVKPAAPATVVETPLLSTVRFKIDSDVISPEEEVNVYNIAEWMKANPSKSLVINGYADKDTGTSDYNMALSQRRADAVKAALVNQYGIDAKRLTVKYDGSQVQPYDVNNWNRIVIFSAD